MKKTLEDFLVVANLIIVIGILSYTGFSKISDIDTFQVQLSQSPIIPELLIEGLSISLPIFELLICAMIVWEKFRVLGLYLSLHLFLFFTVYLIVLFTFFQASKIPCACGGVFSKMSYPSHIVLNLLITVICYFGFSIELSRFSTERRL